MFFSHSRRRTVIRPLEAQRRQVLHTDECGSVAGDSDADAIGRRSVARWRRIGGPVRVGRQHATALER